jgi:hypothetical protein
MKQVAGRRVGAAGIRHATSGISGSGEPLELWLANCQPRTRRTSPSAAV